MNIRSNLEEVWSRGTLVRLYVRPTLFLYFEHCPYGGWPTCLVMPSASPFSNPTWNPINVLFANSDVDKSKIFRVYLGP